MILVYFYYVNIESMFYSVFGDMWVEGWDFFFFNMFNNSLRNVKLKLYISGILNYKNKNFNFI